MTWKNRDLLFEITAWGTVFMAPFFFKWLHCRKVGSETRPT
jgi:hypothetical protein